MGVETEREEKAAQPEPGKPGLRSRDDDDERQDQHGNHGVLRIARGKKKRAEQLEEVRGMVAEKLPHVASALQRPQLEAIWDAMHRIAVNAHTHEREVAAHRRARERHGESYWMLSSFNDQIDAIQNDYVKVGEKFHVPMPMEALLDPAILALRENNILAQQKFRNQLWDTVRKQPGSLWVDLSGPEMKLQLFWAPEGAATYTPVGADGGRVTFDELMGVPELEAAYNAEVHYGPEYQYLFRYHQELGWAIEEWEGECDFLREKVDEHPWVTHVSFWVRGRVIQYPPMTWTTFRNANELNEAAAEALRSNRIEEASFLLQAAEEEFMIATKKVQDWDAGVRKGVVRALVGLTVLKEAGKLAGGVLTGRGPLAAGQFGRAMIQVGAGTGAMSFTQDVAQQGSAIQAGQQGGFDLGGALMRSGKDGVVAAVATWTGLHATRWAHGALRPAFMKYPGVPDIVRRHAPEVLGGAIASPAATGTDVALSALTGEGRVPGSAGELGQMVIEDITTGAVLQVGLSPVIGRLDGSNVKLKPPGKDAYSRGTRGVVTLYHGTDATQMTHLDAGVDVAASGYPHDFGPGFYTSPERIAGDAYANTRAQQRDGSGAVAEVHVRVEDLGRIVDVRPGGAHREAWEKFLHSRFNPDGPKIAGVPDTWADILAINVEMRATAFETFLRKEGLADADTIFGPLGDPYTGGITGGASTQVSIRNPDVARLLDKLGLRFSAPKP